MRRDTELIECPPVGERLAGMIDCGFQVDERLVADLRHRHELSVREIGLEILTIGECTNAERIAVGSEHRNALAHVLGGSTAHYCAGAGLELPGPLASGNHERITTQPLHRHLERGE